MGSPETQSPEVPECVLVTQIQDLSVENWVNLRVNGSSRGAGRDKIREALEKGVDLDRSSRPPTDGPARRSRSWNRYRFVTGLLSVDTAYES